MSHMRLHDPAGNRLYLNAEERAAFGTSIFARRWRARCIHNTDLGGRRLGDGDI